MTGAGSMITYEMSPYATSPAADGSWRAIVTFFELFQPGLKHLREEKERQRMLVSKPTHGGGAPLGIDLDAGTAKITITPKVQPADPPAEVGAVEKGTPDERDENGEEASEP